MTEETIGMAAKLYDARRCIRSLAGDSYKASVEPWITLVRKVMAAEKKQPLQACIVLGKGVEDVAALLWLFAATVEVVEAEGRSHDAPVQ